MGSWEVPAGSRICHAVIGDLGDVGVLLSTRRVRSAGVDGVNNVNGVNSVDGGNSTELHSYHVAVIGYVKKKSLQSLAWATSMERLAGGDGVLVEEVEVGEMWRQALNEEHEEHEAGQAPSAPSVSPVSSAPVGLVSTGGPIFWVVRGDGRCVGYEWVRGDAIGRACLVGGSIVGVGRHATFEGVGDAMVPFVLRDTMGGSGVGLVSWKRLVDVAIEADHHDTEVPMMDVAFDAAGARVTCVAVCPRGLRVAIGLASGAVVVRETEKEDTERVPEARVLSLEDWGYGAADVGAVSALAWSPDGKVLAVGNSRQGVSVWTIQGCRLFSTLVTRSGMKLAGSPRLMIVGGGGSRPVSAEGSDGIDRAMSGMNAASVDTSFEAENGVDPFVSISHLSFSRHATQLLVQSKRYPQMFFEVSFARCIENHAILERQNASASTSKAAFSFLVGSDRLLLITPQLAIEHVGLPQQYLESSFPIRHASLNSTQKDIVVAGSSGLAVYSIPKAKWRLIGDMSQDKSLLVGQLGWVHSDVIAVCAEVKSTGRGNKPSAFGANGPKLLFLPKGHLDASSVLGAHDLPSDLGMPVVMDVSNGRISIVFDRGEVHILRYTCVAAALGVGAMRVGGEDQGRVDSDAVPVRSTAPGVAAVHVDLEYSFEIPTAGGGRACDVDTLRSLSVMKRGDGSMWCLLLWDTGELGCIDLHEQRFTVLARDIDYYWIPESKEVGTEGGARGRHSKTSSTISTGSSALKPTNTWWWTYGKNGMSLWLEDRCETTASDPELGFDPEVLPIGVSLDDMSVIGLQHRTHKRRGQFENPALSIDFAPTAERQPVLACLLRRLLQNDRLEEALQLADSYSSGPQFARSMEWLLYTALDAAFDVLTRADENPSGEATGNNAARGTDLSKTAELVSNFSQFSQLVVAVARKVDAAMWPLLFEATGSPSKLCESSINDGALDHAAAYLLIVHDVVGPVEAGRLAIKTLKSALATSKYMLCANLMLFLGDMANIAEAHRISEAAQGGPGPRSDSGGYVSWIWNWIAPESADSTTTTRVNGNSNETRVNGHSDHPSDLTKRLHTAISSQDPMPPAATDILPLVEAWKILSKHAWHILEDGNVRQLASMDKAMTGIHGGLAALLQTTAHLHACSLGHITPSASLIANALFISGNEMTSASATELEEIPDLMESLLSAGCINYGLALAIVSGNAAVMRNFAEHNKDTWDRLIALISNDVHLCSFASVLMTSGGRA